MMVQGTKEVHHVHFHLWGTCDFNLLAIQGADWWKGTHDHSFEYIGVLWPLMIACIIQIASQPRGHFLLLFLQIVQLWQFFLDRIMPRHGFLQHLWIRQHGCQAPSHKTQFFLGPLSYFLGATLQEILFIVCPVLQNWCFSLFSSLVINMKAQQAIQPRPLPGTHGLIFLHFLLI